MENYSCTVTGEFGSPVNQGHPKGCAERGPFRYSRSRRASGSRSCRADTLVRCLWGKRHQPLPPWKSRPTPTKSDRSVRPTQTNAFNPSGEEEPDRCVQQLDPDQEGDSLGLHFHWESQSRKWINSTVSNSGVLPCRVGHPPRNFLELYKQAGGRGF